MAFIEASKTGSGGSGDGVPVGALMTFSGEELPEGYEPAETEEQISIQQLNDNLSGFKFYPTGTGIVGLIADDSPYTNADGNYILAKSTTGQAMIDGVTYKSINSTEDTRGEVGADTATPFSGGKTNYTLIENGGNYLPYGAVWTRITRFKERKNYLVGMKIIAGSSGIASFEIKNGNVQLKHSTSSYINDSNYLSLRVNGDYIEARNCTNSGSGILNYVIWEINA